MNPWLTATQARKHLGGMSRSTWARWKVAPDGRTPSGQPLYSVTMLDELVRIRDT